MEDKSVPASEQPRPPWQRSNQRKPARAPLTQDLIVDTALAVLAEEGIEAVTMRRVAQGLDTGPASLYAHVSNKEELHELMADRVLGEVPLPRSIRRTGARSSRTCSPRSSPRWCAIRASPGW